MVHLVKYEVRERNMGWTGQPVVNGVTVRETSTPVKVREWTEGLKPDIAGASYMPRCTLSERPESRSTFELRITAFFTPDEFQAIMTAYALSKYGHLEQRRDDGTRYFDHPRAVALIILDELKLMYRDMLVLALLHDIREDAYLLSPWVIEKIYGKSVMVGINLLTKTEGVDYIPRLLEYGTWQVLAVKCCDRLHNLRTLHNCTDEKQHKQIAETRAEYPAVLDRLDQILPAKRRYVAVWLRDQIETICAEYENRWAIYSQTSS